MAAGPDAELPFLKDEWLKGRVARFLSVLLQTSSGPHPELPFLEDETVAYPDPKLPFLDQKCHFGRFSFIHKWKWNMNFVSPHAIIVITPQRGQG